MRKWSGPFAAQIAAAVAAADVELAETMVVGQADVAVDVAVVLAVVVVEPQRPRSAQFVVPFPTPSLSLL